MKSMARGSVRFFIRREQDILSFYLLPTFKCLLNVLDFLMDQKTFFVVLSLACPGRG
jgi:hypothetical protein